MGIYEKQFPDANWGRIPARCREALLAHIETGRQVGSFLTAVLVNDFVEACCSADDENLEILIDYAKFLYMHAPGGCWGSDKAVTQWAKRGGLEGIEKERSAA